MKYRSTKYTMSTADSCSSNASDEKKQICQPMATVAAAAAAAATDEHRVVRTGAQVLRSLTPCQLALFEAQRWAMWTTLAGVANILTSRGVGRRIMWVGLMAAAMSVGLAHLVMSVRNFTATPVASQVTVNAAQAEFPSVTICSLKPASESLLEYYGSVFHRHLDVHWGYFDRWFEYERRQGPDESDADYKLRVVRLLFQLLEVWWVSDDLRDLSLMDQTSILDCRFNGRVCTHRNFSLLQHYHSWNCYMFRPHPDLRYENPAGEHEAGLVLNVFTDSNFLLRSTDASNGNLSAHQNGSSSLFSRSDYHVKGMSLREMLASSRQEGGLQLNKLLDENQYNADGFEVILHPSDSYPMFHKSKFIVRNFRSAMHHVFTMEQNKLDRPESRCTDQAPETVKYVSSFGGDPYTLYWRHFGMGAEEMLNERVQAKIFQRCRCYSHRLPFRVDKTQLCYYAAPQHRFGPTATQLARIHCHDVWHHRALSDPERFSAGDAAIPCRRTYREVQSKSTLWPSDEDLLPVTMLYLVSRFSNGTEFIEPGDRHNHRLFNFTDPSVRAVATEDGQQPLLSREKVALQEMLRPHCFGHSQDFNESHMSEVTDCIDQRLVRRNLLRISVLLASPAATVYNETLAYDSLEFLSEIGGVLGLWFGVSVLTVLEFIELAYILVCTRVRGIRQVLT